MNVNNKKETNGKSELSDDSLSTLTIIGKVFI